MAKSAVLLAAVLFASSLARAAPVTYEEAFAQAKAQSVDAKRAAITQQLAAIDRDLVAYSDDPRVNVSGAWSARWGVPNSSGSSPRTPAKAAEINAVKPFETWAFTKDQTYAAQVSAMLYDWGRYDAALVRANAAVEAKTLAVDELDEVLRYKVARAYAAVAAADRVITVTAAQVAIAAKKLAAQTSNYQHGLRPESDVVTAEVEVGRARLADERAHLDAEGTRVALAVLMGGGVDPNALEIARSGGAGGLDVNGIVTVADQWAKTARPAAVQRREKERAVLDADSVALDVATKPTLTGAVGIQEAGTLSSKPAWKPALTSQVAIGWDVPWNGMRRDQDRRIAMQRQDLALQDEADARVRSDKEKIAHAVLAAGVRQWGALEKQLVLIEKQKTLVQRRYEQGKASAIELGASEADLASFRLEQVKVVNTQVAAALDVAEARGATDLGSLFQGGGAVR